MNTEEFLRLMLAGKPHEAFTLVYNQAMGIVRVVCHQHRITDPQDQLEVMQETMTSLMRFDWSSFRSECELSTFIHGIAARRCLDFHRKKASTLKTQSLTPEDDDPDAVKSADTTEDTSIASAEQRLCAKMAIEELRHSKPRWYEALSRWVTGDMSLEDLAEWMGLSVKSLYNLIVKVKSFMAELCRKHCGTADCSAVHTG